MNPYPLYDIPYLVRDPNDFRMSAARHALELRNQAIVDDYFLARAQGLSAADARTHVAKHYHLTLQQTKNALDWFYHEAKKRKKYDFLQKYSLLYWNTKPATSPFLIFNS